MNIFAYRLPGRVRIMAACSQNILDGIVRDSFVIAPFDPAAGGCRSIPFERKIVLDDIDGLLDTCRDPETSARFPFPQASTTRGEYDAGIDEIVSRIRNGKLEKCVLARVKVKDGRISVGELLEKLGRKYPDAMVFMFHTPDAGTWIGASPEILLEFNGYRCRSMALAGTRPLHEFAMWSKKNIHEHDVVRRYMQTVLTRYAGNVKVGNPKILEAGPVEHLVSRVTFELEDPSPEQLRKVSEALSPTPALSGFPKHAAIETIGRVENFERGFYGGFFGPCFENGNLTLFVNLRSMRITKDRYCLFAGGGIMGDSDAVEEWAETERKAATLLEVIENEI